MSIDLRRVGKFRRIVRSDKSPACTGSSGFATEEIRKEDLKEKILNFIFKIFETVFITYQDLVLKTLFRCLFRIYFLGKNKLAIN